MYVYTTILLSIHLSMDTNYFHILAIVNNAAVNNCYKQLIFELVLLVFLGKYPKVKLLDHMLVLLFWEPPYCFPQWPYQFISLPPVHKGSPFTRSSPPLVVSSLFDESHSDRCEVISHCGFDVHLMVNSVEHLLLCMLAICVSLEKCLFRSSA